MLDFLKTFITGDENVQKAKEQRVKLEAKLASSNGLNNREKKILEKARLVTRRHCLKLIVAGLATVSTVSIGIYEFLFNNYYDKSQTNEKNETEDRKNELPNISFEKISYQPKPLDGLNLSQNEFEKIGVRLGQHIYEDFTKRFLPEYERADITGRNILVQKTFIAYLEYLLSLYPQIEDHYNARPQVPENDTTYREAYLNNFLLVHNLFIQVLFDEKESCWRLVLNKIYAVRMQVKVRFRDIEIIIPVIELADVNPRRAWYDYQLHAIVISEPQQHADIVEKVLIDKFSRNVYPQDRIPTQDVVNAFLEATLKHEATHALSQTLFPKVYANLFKMIPADVYKEANFDPISQQSGQLYHLDEITAAGAEIAFFQNHYLKLHLVAVLAQEDDESHALASKYFITQLASIKSLSDVSRQKLKDWNIVDKSRRLNIITDVLSDPNIDEEELREIGRKMFRFGINAMRFIESMNY